MTARTGLAAECRELAARHAALLRPSRPPVTRHVEEAVAAVEAARIRAQGGKRPEAAQLSLDVSPRGESSPTACG